MAKKKLMGYRHNFDTPAEWIVRRDNRAVFYRIELLGEASTPDGDMLIVKIQHAELTDPNNDVAMLLGQVKIYRKNSRLVDPQSPELWFWDDKFWVKARAADGSTYYNNKCYLLYSIEIKDPDKLVDRIIT